MSNTTVKYKLNISGSEAKNGTKKVITRRGKHLEVTIPAGVKTGTLVKLSGALQITDGYYGDILIQIKVKRRYRPGVIAAVAVACFFALMYFLPTEEIPTEDTSGYIYTNGAIECGGDGEPIELINNPDATNPTYAELVAFIEADTTDTKDYIEESFRDWHKAYVCADFAEEVHNNAETAGIRAAWVGIDIEGEDEGHALNAFETTDRGLVYIDCTGANPGGLGAAITEPLITELLKQYGHAPPPEPASWDTVAFIGIGKKYGRIDIAQAESLSYSYYEEYMQKWQEFESKLEAYNKEVELYNQEISGKVYIIGSAEDIRMTAWEARLEEEGQALDKLVEELGEGYYEQVGIVKDIHIHW
jgi:hypothetical protein